MRAKALLAFLCLGLLAAMALLGLRAGRVGYEGLVLAVPDGMATHGQTVKALEKLADEKFPLTYEAPTVRSVEALQSAYNATIIGTNDSYAALMGYTLLDGSFFTGAAVDHRDRFAVLGEAAAAQLFGTVKSTGMTFRMNGETWLVVGVIRDSMKTADLEEDDLNIYVPASRLDAEPTALLAQGEAATVQSGLKNLGIHDSTHHMISVDMVGRAMWERLGVLLRIAAAGILALLLRRWGKRLLVGLRRYRDGLGSRYLRELVAEKPRDVVALSGLATLLVAGGGAILALALQILPICMGWQENLAVFADLSDQWFGNKVRGLQDLQLASTVLFWVFLAIYAVFFIVLLLKRTVNGSDKMQENSD